MKNNFTIYEYKEIDGKKLTKKGIICSFTCKRCNKNFVTTKSGINIILNFKYCPRCGKEIKNFLKLESNQE